MSDTGPLAGCNTPLSWHGLYSGQTALLTPDSFAHPAKMAPALCFRIFDHLAEMGLLEEGDTVLDQELLEALDKQEGWCDCK